MTKTTTAIAVLNTADQASESSQARLIALVLDGVTSEHSRRSYRTGLERFFGWIETGIGVSATEPAFTKAVVQGNRSSLLDQGLSSSAVNLRLSPLRKLAREMADNGMLDPATAAAIERVPGVERRGNRVGNWLMKEQANDLLNAPDSKTITGQRDRAILAQLLVCGLRRAELLRIQIEDLEQREGRWVLPDMAGRGNRIRTVTVPAGIKTRTDTWLKPLASRWPAFPAGQQGLCACRVRDPG